MDRRRVLVIGSVVVAALLTLNLIVFGQNRDGEDAEARSSPTARWSLAPLGTATGTTTTAAVSTTATASIPSTTTAPPDPVATTAPTPGPSFRSSIGAVTEEDLPASWRSGCPVDVESLREVGVSHWGYDGRARTGRLIVAAAVAEDMVAIMSRLFAAGFPVERMEPVDVFGGDDGRSMAANNTSAFNCRAVTGGSAWSEHSYGTAIDVNPLVNPYVRGATVLPPEGRAYADRDLDAPGMIHDGDVVVESFASRGWIWGGSWSASKDYQHFSTSGR